MKLSLKSIALAASATLLSTAVAGNALAGGMASRVAPQAQASDLGVANSGTTVTLALSLKVNNLDELKSFVATTVDRSSANYR